MPQSSPPSHDGSAAINSACPDDQKLYFKDTTQKQFTLVCQHLHCVMTNLYAEQRLVECQFDQYQNGPMQVDASRLNTIRVPSELFEVCRAGEPTGFIPFAGEDP